jgi:steroid delta-isomerase-like uncharacterized protein
MAGADVDEFVLSLRQGPGIGPSGTLRAAGGQHEEPFEGWIDLISLITQHRRTPMDHTTTMRSTYSRISAGDLEGFGDLVADDFVEHDEIPGLAPTKDGMLAYFRILLTAFPDMQMNVEDIIASNDKSVARVRATATHNGEFMGVPPTGKTVEVQLIDIMRFDDAGLVSEHWGVVDMLSLMQQLGVVPTDQPA